MQSLKNKLKLFLLLPVFLIIVMIGYYLVRPVVSKKTALNSSTSSTSTLFGDGINLKMDKPRMMADNNGRKEWEIEADTITGSLDQVTKFKAIRIKFFPPDQKIVTASAETGKVNNQNKNMEMKGSVVINSEKFVLKTPVINWNAEEKRMETDAPVEIQNNRFEIKGDGLITDADFSLIKVKGSVRALVKTQGQ